MLPSRLSIRHTVPRLIVIALVVVLAAGYAPARSALAWSTATVTCSSDDAKVAPDISATSLATFYQGQTVTVTGELSADGIWSRVSLSNGQLAWMKTVCVGGTVTPTTPTTPTVSGHNIMITTGALNVRSGPGWWYDVLATYYRGAVLALGTYRTADANWVQVVLPQGQPGWINAHYATAGISIWSMPVYGATTSPTATITAGAVNVRSGPGWNYGIIGTFYQGTVLTLGNYRSYDSQWVQVYLPGGGWGWANTAYVATSVPVYTLAVYGTTPPPPPPPPTTRTHVVQPGENLFRIGLQYGVNWLQIAAANGIGYPYTIYAGQTLLIP